VFLESLVPPGQTDGSLQVTALILLGRSRGDAPQRGVGKRHCRGGQRISSWYPQVLIADLLRSPGGAEQLFAALDRLVASAQR
jgi:hypothetical protein